MAARQVIYDKGGTLSTINGLLKDDYVINQIVDQVNKSTVFLSQLKSQKTTHGRKFIFPIQTNTSQGVGSRPENSALPDGGFGEYDQATGNVKYLYSNFYITGQSIEATADSSVAFADALKQAIKDCREAMKLEMQRQVWGDGTGAIGLVKGAVVDAAIVPVDSPYALVYQTALTNAQNTRLFRRKMNLYFDSGTDAAGTVSTVNSDGTITLTANVSLDDNAVIYRGDSTTANNKNNEIDGINAICANTGTYLGIDRTGIPEWQANLIALNGSLDLDNMRLALDTAEQYGTASPNIMLTDYVTRQRYEALLTSLKRFTSPMQLEGGYTSLEFDGKPFVVDKDAPPERIYFLNTEDIVWMVMKEVGFADRDGAVLARVANRDAYEAFLVTYRNLACKRPNNQVVLTGITG